MKTLHWLKHEWPILLIVVLALVMRIWPHDYVYYDGMSNDVSLQVYRFIHEGEIPLYGYDFLRYTAHYGPAPIYLYSLFGLLSTAPFSAVLFTLLLSTATTYVLYSIGRDFWNRLVGLIAALLWASAHFSTVTARIVVGANLAPLFVSLFLYSLLALVHKKNPAYYGLLFFAGGIMLQIHITMFPLLLLVIPAIFFGLPNSRKWLAIGCCILVILVLPHLYGEASNWFTETRLLLPAILGVHGGETTSVFADGGDFFLHYVNPFEKHPHNNPFVQTIGNMDDYFCEDPAQHSLFGPFLKVALDSTSTMAWLLFLTLPFLFCLWFLRQRRNIGSIEFRGPFCLVLGFCSSLLLLMLLPHNPLFPSSHRHLHTLFIITILLWAVGFGWLLPTFAGRYKQTLYRATLLFVLFVTLVNSASWIVFHASNPQKDCVNTIPALGTCEVIADVLAEDQRFLQQPDEALVKLFSIYDRPPGKLYGMPYIVMDAIRRHARSGGHFVNLSGRYILVKEHSLPFRLAPTLSEKKMGIYTLIRQSFLVNTSSLFFAKVGDSRDIKTAWARASGHTDQWSLGEPWPPVMPWNCVNDCPPLGFDSPDCRRCLDNSTVYLRAALSQNRTARTLLVVNEFTAEESFLIGAISLNGEPLYQGRELLGGEKSWPQEIMVDVTGRLNESQNLLEILLVSQPGFPEGNQVRPDIYALSGE